MNENYLVLCANIGATTTWSVQTISAIYRWKSASMSGMVVIEVGQLTAHEPDEDMLQNLVTDKVVKRMEKEGRKVVLYFDEVSLGLQNILFQN